MKTINPRFVPSVIGAAIGGTLLEQDNDAYGVALGLGIGALTGYNFRVSLPDTNKLVYKNQVVALPENRLSEIDTKKKELLEMVDGFTPEQFKQLPGNMNNVNYDKYDMYGTLSEKNIRQAISDALDIEELRRISIAATSPERFTKITNVHTIPSDQIKQSTKHSINIGANGENVDEAVDILRAKFSMLGYSQDELEAKLVMFKNAIANVDRVIVDENTDKVTLKKDDKSTVFKLSSQYDDEGISSHTDHNNLHAVRRVNPNAKMLTRDPTLARASVADTNGAELAKELGIENADAKTIQTLNGVHSDGLKLMKAMHMDVSKFSPEDLRVLSKHLGENKVHGYKPEDIKAMLYGSPLYNAHENLFDSWLDSAYQHRQEESAYISAGFDRDFVHKNVANDLTKRISGQQDFGKSFIINSESGLIDMDRPLADISYKGSDKTASEHRQFLDILRNYIDGVDDGKKADHNNIAANGKTKRPLPFNINSPMERNPHTASRDGRSESLGRNSIANTFEYLKEQGLVPSEYSSAIATRRMSVEGERFNQNLLEFGGMASGFNAVTDGGSIGSEEALRNFNTTGMRTLKLSPDGEGTLELSDKVVNLLRDRQAYDVTPNHTGLNVDKTLQRLDKHVNKINDLTKAIRELESKPLPEPHKPDPKFNIQEPTTWMSRATNVALHNQRYLAKHPDANSDPAVRPITIEDAKAKVEHDYNRGVRAKKIGWESARNNVDTEIENRQHELSKLRSQLEKAKESAQVQIDNLKTSLNDKMNTQGSSNHLENVLDRVRAMDLNTLNASSNIETLKSITGDINKFNSIANASFAPGEIIGIAGNGEKVALSDEFKDYKLHFSTYSPADGKRPRLKGNFVFKGTNNIGDMGTIKVFGGDHKQNIAIADRNSFAYAQAQAIFNSVFEKAYDTDGSHFGKRQLRRNANGDIEPTHSIPISKGGGKKKKKVPRTDQDYFNIHLFRNRETNEFVKMSDKSVVEHIDNIAKSLLNGTADPRMKEMAVISSIENNGQEIAMKVANTLMLHKGEDVVKQLTNLDQVTKQTKNGSITETFKKKDSINENLVRAVTSLARADDTGYVRASEGWALGQMMTALTENKASMNALMGMRVLGTDRLIHDLTNITSAADKLLNPDNTALISSLEQHNLMESMKSIDSVLGSNYLLDKIDELRATNLEGFEPGQFGKIFSDSVMDDYNARVNELFSHFNSAGALAKFITEGGINDDMANLFRYAYTNYGESVMLASPDVSQGFSTGSGRLGKTMSHMAQTNLLSAGLPKEMLSLFGELDEGSLYDYKALTTLDKNVSQDVTLNTLLDSMVYDKDGNFDKAGFQRANMLIRNLDSRDPDEVRQILRDSGGPKEIIDELVKGEFLRFELGNNKHNMTNLPIYMETTDRNGTYISQDAQRTVKPLKKAQSALLTDAFFSMYADPSQNLSSSTKKQLNAKVGESIKNYLKTWTDAVGNINNPMLKDVMARHAHNSSYLKVVGTTSERLGSLVKKTFDNSPDNKLKGRSFAGISRQKAAELVEQYYGGAYRVTSDTFFDVYQKQMADITGGNYRNLRSIDDFIDEETGAIRVTTKEGKTIPLYTMLNREPTHSSFSISPYELVVLSNREIASGVKNSNDSIFIHTADKHYETLMVGDFDNDHVLMYSVFKQINNEEAGTLEEYATKIASVRNELIPLMKNLSVKSNKEGHPGIYDVTNAMQVIEDDMGTYKPAGMTVEEFRKSDQYWEEVDRIANERRGNASVKGGVRKTLSAPVVQLSVHLANSIHTSEALNKDFLVHAVAKALNHALVENIIKTQHIPTEEFANQTQLDVEPIFRLRKALADGDPNVKTDQYRKHLTSFFNGMIEVARKDNPDLIQLEDALKQKGMSLEKIVHEIVEGDIRNISDPKYAPTSLLEYSKIAVRIEELGYDASTLSSLIRDVGTKVHGDKLSLLDFVDEEAKTDIRKSLVIGTDELLKVAKKNLEDNKKVLSIGGALLGVGAVITQKDPDFSANKSVRADTQGGTIAPAMAANMSAKNNDAAIVQAQGRDKSEYIRPGKGLDRVKQNYSVNASYQGQEGREAVGAKEAIFGKNITNVNINQNNSY